MPVPPHLGSAWLGWTRASATAIEERVGTLLVATQLPQFGLPNPLRVIKFVVKHSSSLPSLARASLSSANLAYFATTILLTSKSLIAPSDHGPASGPAAIA